MTTCDPPSSATSAGQSRRSFLRSGAAATVAAATSRFAFAAPTGKKKVRIGVVGGNFGANFYFHEHPDAVVTAVSDLRPERRDKLMKTYRCKKSYESLEKLILDRNVDAVFVATPAPDHARHVAMVLGAGKHVMSAVPAAFGSLEDCEKLIDRVKSSGLLYMMSETSYFQQATIAARDFHKEGRFGKLYYTKSEYHHDGLEELYFENGKRTWRYGITPMWYPTHCTAHFVSVTGERLTEVSCVGWGDDSPVLKDNAYGNPFWNETAFFKSRSGLPFAVDVWWKGAHRGGERAEWYGDKMSFLAADPNGLGPHEGRLVQSSTRLGKDDGGFVRREGTVEPYADPQYWNTDRLPQPLRFDSGHAGSHTFLTHEFVEAVAHLRKPAVDVYEAVAYTAPGIVAHESAMKGGLQMKIPQFDAA